MSSSFPVNGASYREALFKVTEPAFKLRFLLESKDCAVNKGEFANIIKGSLETCPAEAKATSYIPLVSRSAAWYDRGSKHGVATAVNQLSKELMGTLNTYSTELEKAADFDIRRYDSAGGMEALVDNVHSILRKILVIKGTYSKHGHEATAAALQSSYDNLAAAYSHAVRVKNRVIIRLKALEANETVIRLARQLESGASPATQPPRAAAAAFASRVAPVILMGDVNSGEKPEEVDSDDEFDRALDSEVKKEKPSPTLIEEEEKIPEAPSQPAPPPPNSSDTPPPNSSGTPPPAINIPPPPKAPGTMPGFKPSGKGGLLDEIRAGGIPSKRKSSAPAGEKSQPAWKRTLAERKAQRGNTPKIQEDSGDLFSGLKSAMDSRRGSLMGSAPSAKFDSEVSDDEWDDD